MIRFKHLKIENFCSFERAELTFPQSGLVLVEGENLDSSVADSNCSGKTNLMEAIFFALYGTTTKVRRPGGSTFASASVSDFIRRGTKGLRVELEFDLDGKTATIHRSRTKHPGLKLFVDGEQVQASSTSAVQLEIEKLVGMNWLTFSQTCFLGQGLFRFAQASDAERKSVFDGLLNTERFQEAEKRARGRCREIETTRLKKIVRRERLIERIEAGKEEIDEYNRLLVEVQEKRADRVSEETKTLREKVRIAEQEVSSLFSKEVEEFDEDEFEELRDQLASSEAVLNLAIENVEAVDGDRFKKGVCPTCLRKISPAVASKLLLEERTRLQAVVSSADKAFRKLKNRYGKEKEIGARSDKWFIAFNRFNDLKELLEEQVVTHEEANSDVTALEESKEKAAKRLLASKVELKKTEKTIRVLEADIEQAEFWVKGFGNKGIRSLLLDETLPVLNGKANQYAQQLLGGEVVLTLDTQVDERDVFDVRVESVSTGAEGYHACSGGERRRIDLCLALALRSLAKVSGSEVGLLVLDEPFESVDETGVEAFVRSLEGFVKERNVVCYVVTHLRGLKSLFSHSITVRRKGGVSTLEIGDGF